MSLRISVSESQRIMGEAAAGIAAESIADAIERNGSARVIFAAAPSQDEFLASLRRDPTIEWSKVVAFHLDEYLGLPQDAPQRFANYLDEHLFDHVGFRDIHYLSPESLLPQEACQRYESLLAEGPLDLACIGIGENGHLAFNDPHVADFKDPACVKMVELDEACRHQQVNDGCFSRLEEVPSRAITVTIPTILSARTIVCVVPGERKRAAVRQAICGPITPACPASALRSHENTTLFCDEVSARSLGDSRTGGGGVLYV